MSILIDFTGKLIGKVGYGLDFNPWVFDTTPVKVNKDQHVCGFTWQTGNPFADAPGLDHIEQEAIHIAHTCSDTFVKQIVFTSRFPAEPAILEYHSDDTVRSVSEEDNGDGTKTTVVVSTLTKPKLAVDNPESPVAQNDDAWLWPLDHDFNFNDDFKYTYAITLADAWTS